VSQHEDAMKATETGRDRQGCIGNDAAFSMSFAQARTVAGGVPTTALEANHFDDGKPRSVMSKTTTPWNDREGISLRA